MTKKIKLKISSRLVKKRSRRNGFGPKQCRFCTNAAQLENIDYKNSVFLRGFLTERGKILPSRISGSCNLHQRALAREIRISRSMVLLPYSARGF